MQDSTVVPKLVPSPRSLIGVRAVRAGLLATAVAGVGYGLAHPGSPGSVVLAGSAALGLGAVFRWRHRWGYQWVGSVWTKRRPVPEELVLPGGEAEGLAVLRRELLPELRIRSAGPANARIGLIEDGSAWVAVVAVERGGGQAAVLNPAILVPLLHDDEVPLAAVQVLVHSVPSPHGDVPRTELVRVALRLDPRTAGPGSERMNVPSFQRTLRLRARRAIELLAAEGWRGRTMDAAELRTALHTDAAMETQPDAPGRQRWRSWTVNGHRHTVFWLRRWSPGLQEQLTLLPAEGVVLAVTLVPDRDTVAATTLLRVISPKGTKPPVRKAARACRAQLVPLHGEHHQGVLGTLPLGHDVKSRLSWRPRHDTAGPLLAGQHGLPLGTAEQGRPVTLPLFQERPEQIAVLAGPSPAMLLAWRAVGAGVTVGVITDRPDTWAGPVEVVPPGAEPVAGTCLWPRLVIRDHVGPTTPPVPWCSVIDLQADPTAGTLAGYESALVHRPSTATVDLLTKVFGLPAGATHSLRMMPRQAMALVYKGSVRLVDLAPSPDERPLLEA